MEKLKTMLATVMVFLRDKAKALFKIASDGFVKALPGMKTKLLALVAKLGWKKIAIGAAVLIFIGIAVFFFLNRSPDKKEEKKKSGPQIENVEVQGKLDKDTETLDTLTGKLGEKK